MSSSPVASAASQTAANALQALQEARDRTLELVASISEEDLERVHSTLMSPLVWDLGHIAAFEDLWIAHNYGGLPLLREDLAEVYDAMETPRARRGDLPFLDATAARSYLEEVRERTIELTEASGVGDGVAHELVLRHEQQHNETMLQAMQLAHLGGPAPSTCAARGPSVGAGGLELVEVPAGPCTIGAPAQGFAYDNERPRHVLELDAFSIGRTAITNASFLHFVEGGGYERREWWSDEGWAWKEQYDITRPGAWTTDRQQEWQLGELEPLHPHRPVIHVSWYEADAFARSHDARLPTELEWEKAATWDQHRHQARAFPWGEGPPKPGIHGNLDQFAGGRAPAGDFPQGASPHGCLGMIGGVWEWTSSAFGAYPGFRAFPYREYSEPFFGDTFRVLRGGSWATRARVATPTFRNWDYPQRRQIFSGFRIARDA